MKYTKSMMSMKPKAPGKPIPAAKHDTKMSDHGPLASRVEKMKQANRAYNPGNRSA